MIEPDMRRYDSCQGKIVRIKRNERDVSVEFLSRRDFLIEKIGTGCTTALIPIAIFKTQGITWFRCFRCRCFCAILWGGRCCFASGTTHFPWFYLKMLSTNQLLIEDTHKRKKVWINRGKGSKYFHIKNTLSISTHRKRHTLHLHSNSVL